MYLSSLNITACSCPCACGAVRCGGGTVTGDVMPSVVSSLSYGG